MISPFTVILRAARANPAAIDWATSSPVTPYEYSRCVPSGSVSVIFLSAIQLCSLKNLFSMEDKKNKMYTQANSCYYFRKIMSGLDA